jgi:pSer/pThr/pTyr-binding forkhead associated (FHA) protein
VNADREFYERVLARGGPDTVEFPRFYPERRIVLQGSTTLIGRHNRDQGVEPEIDLGIHPVDRGVSTQHAVLRIRDSGLTVTDLGSTNGTSLNGSEDLLTEGRETPLADGDRIHIGAWTTITIAQA